MLNCFNTVKLKFINAFKDAFEGINIDPIICSANPKFGDYQCNSLMQVFKLHGRELNMKSPQEVGLHLKKYLETDIFSQVNVAPQGFVTVKLSSNWLNSQLKQGLNLGFIKKAEKKLKILVDFSSPNIAKELHVGHLRSTILGDSICRIAEKLGHDVKRINHVGDWGTQFGMLIENMREKYPNFESELPPLSALIELYQESKKRFDSDPDFKKRSQLNVVKLQSGDKDCLIAWKKICEISRNDFQILYNILDIVVEEVGESFYNEMLPSVIEILNNLNITKISDNALCLFTSIDKVPLMLRKSDGAYGYDSTDMAAIWYRLVELKQDCLIYVTDLGQENHFMKIFDGAKQAGWHVEGKTKLTHVGFGLIKGEDGKRLKTRSGDTIKMKDLIEEAILRAKNEIIIRNKDKNDDNILISDPEKSGEIVGVASIKYFDLKQNRLTDYKFSFDKMLDIKGNTAIYLLYANARISSIFRKASTSPNELDFEKLNIEEPSEISLALKIVRLPEIIDDIMKDFYIHRLTEYLYELSVNFSEFYSNCRIIGSPQQESRLVLCHITQLIFSECFALLGIPSLNYL